MDDPTSTPPLNRRHADALRRLDADAQEYFQERAAVRQYDGGLPRAQAEALAWQDLQRWLRQGAQQRR